MGNRQFDNFTFVTKLVLPSAVRIFSVEPSSSSEVCGNLIVLKNIYYAGFSSHNIAKIQKYLRGEVQCMGHGAI